MRNAASERRANPPTTPPATATVMRVLLEEASVTLAASTVLLGDATPGLSWTRDDTVAEVEVGGISIETAALPPAVGVSCIAGSVVIESKLDSVVGAAGPFAVDVDAILSSAGASAGTDDSDGDGSLSAVSSGGMSRLTILSVEVVS